MLTQCYKCKGVGLIKRLNPQKCKYCYNQHCYQCEYKSEYGLYEEYSICWRLGKVDSKSFRKKLTTMTQ